VTRPQVSRQTPLPFCPTRPGVLDPLQCKARGAPDKLLCPSTFALSLSKGHLYALVLLRQAQHERDLAGDRLLFRQTPSPLFHPPLHPPALESAGTDSFSPGLTSRHPKTMMGLLAHETTLSDSSGSRSRSERLPAMPLGVGADSGRFRCRESSRHCHVRRRSSRIL
jgi:hypothetical protein